MLNYVKLCKTIGEVSLIPNRLKEVRENLLISISELARNAGISSLTIARVERGLSCRQQTKRKILAALGLEPYQKHKIFPEQALEVVS